MADEMLSFFYGIEAKNITVDIEIKSDRTEMTFRAWEVNLDEESLYELKQHLQSPRLHELEEYYWGLSGNELSASNELSLIGMMTDEAEIEYKDERRELNIKLIRKV